MSIDSITKGRNDIQLAEEECQKFKKHYFVFNKTD